MTAARKVAPSPATPDAPLSPAVSALEAAFRMIQKRHPDVPNATIVVKRDDRAWGHTTVRHAWGPSSSPDVDRLEIMVSGENLRRGAVHVAATLIHEAAHARNLAAGIRDCDVNGRHNGAFAKAARDMGLVVEDSGWKGWTITSLDDLGAQKWRAMIATIERGLAKAAAAAPHASSGVTVTIKPTGGSSTPGGIVLPPKRGNRNLVKATCACGHSLRISRGAWAATQPTCQTCSEVFTLGS